MSSSEYSVSHLRTRQLAARQSGEKLYLSIAGLAKALNAFLAGEVTEEEIADWAEFYDANDDVEFENDGVIATVIFQISSPEINGRLDNARAKDLLSMLESSRNPDSLE